MINAVEPQKVISAQGRGVDIYSEAKFGDAVVEVEVLVAKRANSGAYHVHVPPQYDAKQPTPVVLAFHGAMTNGAIMALSSGLSAKADKEGFIVVYPNGTGKRCRSR